MTARPWAYAVIVVGEKLPAGVHASCSAARAEAKQIRIVEKRKRVEVRVVALYPREDER